jgi:hypothetical protein
MAALQVQRMVLQSFMSCDWQGSALDALTPSFLMDHILPAAAQPIILQKGECCIPVYTPPSCLAEIQCTCALLSLLHNNMSLYNIPSSEQVLHKV